MVPCVSFGVRVRFASQTGILTPIEVIALRTIGLGLDDVQAIADVLGLGQRPVLDLIYDFWLKGYVFVDTSETRVRLAGEAARAFGDGALERLETAENNLEIIPLVQELVSGSVLPYIGRPHPFGPESAFVPTLRSDLALEGVTRADLLDAVQREVERQARKLARPLVAHEVWVEPDQLVTDATAASPLVRRRRFLPLLADVAQNPDSGRLEFDIVDAPDVPPPVRADIARNLATLADRFPDQIFFKKLRAEISRTPEIESPAERESAPDRLRRTVVNLAATDPGVLMQRHEQLMDLYREAVHEVRARAANAAQVRAVVGYEEHEALIRRMLVTAEHQLVLGNPWLRLEALLDPPPGERRSWFDLLEGALARGVQVFLMWGIQPDSKLDPRMRNALVDLAARNPGRFVFSQRSSTLHAKFIVRDAHQALLTSYNFLDPPDHRDSLEIGLVVEGASSGVAPGVALDLLEWARQAFPDYQEGQRMLLLADELGASELGLAELPRPAQVPDATPASDAGKVLPAIRHWASEWVATSENLVTIARHHASGASLVVDREHREALWEALHECKRRLAILSDKLSVDVVSDRFIRVLGARLDDGVSCALVYRREGASDTDAGPAARIVGLAGEHGDRLFPVEARSHAKVLVSDDEVTIGSFNFLSYGGDYEGASGKRERAELSVRVRNRATVDAVLDVLVERWPEAFRHLVEQRSAIVEPASVSALPPTLQPLFRELQGALDPGEPLLRWFAATGDAWRDLDALRQAGVQDALLASAAAAAVAGTSDLEVDGAQRWRRWLAEKLWQDMDFIGAALLLPDSGDGGPGLDAWLAQLGAQVEARRVPVLVPAPGDEPSMGRAQAACLLVLVAALEQGRNDLLVIGQGIESLLPPSFCAWLAAAREFHDDTHQAVPMTLLRQSAGSARRREEFEQAREEFRRALETAENVGFRFQIGEHTWNLLKNPGRLLGTMRRALDANDPAALGRFIDGMDRAQKSPEELMDEASWEVRDEHNQRIEDRKRTSCVTRLRRVTEVARAWIALSAEAASVPSDARVLHACARLRAALADVQTMSVHEIDPLAEPARRLVLSRLEALFTAELT